MRNGFLKIRSYAAKARKLWKELANESCTQIAEILKQPTTKKMNYKTPKEC